MAFSIKTIGKGFFDSAAILKALSKEKRAAFSKAGAFVRQRAKTSIRKRRAVSAPGQPPSSHAGHLRRLIFFAWDTVTESLVVGPTPFDSPRTGPSVVPGVLERGGKSNERTIAARPFMVPALRTEQGKFPDLFKGVLR